MTKKSFTLLKNAAISFKEIMAIIEPNNIAEQIAMINPFFLLRLLQVSIDKCIALGFDGN